MRMDARRMTKVVVCTASRGERQSRRRIARQPGGTGLAGALALALGLQMAPTICCTLLRAIIPGQRPVAPAWGFFGGSLGRVSCGYALARGQMVISNSDSV